MQFSIPVQQNINANSATRFSEHGAAGLHTGDPVYVNTAADVALLTGRHASLPLLHLRGDHTTPQTFFLHELQLLLQTRFIKHVVLVAPGGHTDQAP